MQSPIWRYTDTDTLYKMLAAKDFLPVADTELFESTIRAELSRRGNPRPSPVRKRAKKR
jgi:hypothetical protein